MRPRSAKPTTRAVTEWSSVKIPTTAIAPGSAIQSMTRFRPSRSESSPTTTDPTIGVTPQAAMTIAAWRSVKALSVRSTVSVIRRPFG